MGDRLVGQLVVADAAVLPRPALRSRATHEVTSVLQTPRNKKATLGKSAVLNLAQLVTGNGDG